MHDVTEQMCYHSGNENTRNGQTRRTSQNQQTKHNLLRQRIKNSFYVIHADTNSRDKLTTWRPRIMTKQPQQPRTEHHRTWAFSGTITFVWFSRQKPVKDNAILENGTTETRAAKRIIACASPDRTTIRPRKYTASDSAHNERTTRKSAEQG